MENTTLVSLADVNGNPWVKMTLPPQLRIGEHFALDFTLYRRTRGRTEELRVGGEWRVTSVLYDTRGLLRQTIVVEPLRKPPTWKAIKSPSTTRKLGPTHFPPTEVK